MNKKKVAPKSTKAKSTSPRTKKSGSPAAHHIEHDFIIIVGGGLIVMAMGVFLFLS